MLPWYMSIDTSRHSFVALCSKGLYIHIQHWEQNIKKIFSTERVNKLDCVSSIQDVLTTGDEIMVELHEEVVCNLHYNTSSSRSSSPVAEEVWSMAETWLCVYYFSVCQSA